MNPAIAVRCITVTDTVTVTDEIAKPLYFTGSAHGPQDYSTEGSVAHSIETRYMKHAQGVCENYPGSFSRTVHVPYCHKDTSALA